VSFPNFVLIHRLARIPGAAARFRDGKQLLHQFVNEYSMSILLLSIFQDFARARDVLAEDCLMTKRALSAVAGFLTLCLPLSAQQQTQRPDVFGALNSSVLRLPSLTLSDGGSFSFASAFNRMETPPPDFLPALSATEKPRRATASAASPKDDPSKEVVDVRRPLFDYAGGEMGFLYGRSTGKLGREVEQGYFIGEVGNDKFQISAGASYERSSGRFPHFGR